MSLYGCDVWGKLRDQGVVDDQDAMARCEREAMLCSRLHGFPHHPGVIPKKPEAGFTAVAPGEPICIMPYKRTDPTT